MIDSSSKSYRSSPISIFQYTGKSLLLLIFPLLRLLFVSKFDLRAWLNGSWFDFIIIMLILGYGAVVWWRYTYNINIDGFRIKKGIFIVQNRFIPYEKLSIVVVEKPFYFIPLKLVKLRIDTDGGNNSKADFSIIIPIKQLDTIVEMLTNTGNKINFVYRPKNIYITILSLMVSNSLGGVLFLYTFLSGISTVFGNDTRELVLDQLTDMTYKVTTGIPPVAGTLGSFVVIGWLISFAINLLNNLKFQVKRQNDKLIISSGILTSRDYYLTVKRINYVEYRQNLFTKIFNFYSVFLHCNGYGKTKNELSVVLPAGNKEHIDSTFPLLLPEIHVSELKIKPNKKHFKRFLVPPLYYLTLVIILFLVTNKFIDSFFVETVYFILSMSIIPCLLYMVVKIISFYHTGVSLNNNVYTFSYSYAFRFKTVTIPKERVMKVTIKQSLLQVRSGCCDVVVLSLSEGKVSHIIPNLSLNQIKNFFDINNC